APIQWPFVTRGVAHRLVELKLVDAREEIAGIRDVARDMILRAGVEVGLVARRGRSDALVLLEQCPPCLVIVCGLGLAAEDLPAPLVDEQAKGQEGNLVERRTQLKRNVSFCRRN